MSFTWHESLMVALFVFYVAVPRELVDTVIANIYTDILAISELPVSRSVYLSGFLFIFCPFGQ